MKSNIFKVLFILSMFTLFAGCSNKVADNKQIAGSPTNVSLKDDFDIENKNLQKFFKDTYVYVVEDKVAKVQYIKAVTNDSEWSGMTVRINKHGEPFFSNNGEFELVELNIGNILVDKETGVQYLFTSTLIPRIDKNGFPFIN